MPPSPSPWPRKPRNSARDSSSRSSSSSISRPSRPDSSRNSSGTSDDTAKGPGTTFWLSRAPSPAARGTSWNRADTASQRRVTVCAAGPARRNPSSPLPVSGEKSRRSQCSNAWGERRMPRCSLAASSTVWASSITTDATSGRKPAPSRRSARSENNKWWLATSKSASCIFARARKRKQRFRSGHLVPKQLPCSAHTALHASTDGCRRISCTLPSSVASAQARMRSSSSPRPSPNSSR